ncbi:hypothetical protein [Paenibacillus sp. 7523-1]|uniref:hypothetical protein n=1 Tax=Paenibacillus sp. 7523-1 TaxID=2022550 RepID=UPI000BA7C013|nr:hypothetical protein [Paenibacillus sp. 7523-1]PAD32897.1 hypothetical protein CHH60_02075 [Paenibacillus sp. 7523-1]
MAKTHSGWFLGMMVLMILVLTSCGTRPQNETIIISGSEESEQTHEDLSPVQVRKIYRLPKENVDKGYWLGWSSTKSMIGAFNSALDPEHLQLKGLVYPFEQSGNISEIDMDSTRMMLSPDGTQIADVSTTRITATLKLFSIQNKKETEVETLNLTSQNYLQSLSWSDNSEYISYLIVDAVHPEKNMLRIYDLKTRKSASYVLNGFNDDDTLIGVQVSNDGQNALIKLFDSTQSSRTTVVLGKLIDGQLQIKYKRQIADKQMTWIGDDQFAFLGRDGTLYEYDQRNGELSVIMERVSAYELSSDKKFIAYTLQDEDAVYVGIMQGRNVLYNEPVYHGVLPLNMKWSPDNNRLFIQGPKAFTSPNVIQSDDPTEEPAFIIEFE